MIDLLIVIEVISVYLFDFYVSLARKETSCLLTRSTHECLRHGLNSHGTAWLLLVMLRLQDTASCICNNVDLPYVSVVDQDN